MRSPKSDKMTFGGLIDQSQWGQEGCKSWNGMKQKLKQIHWLNQKCCDEE